jgi:hypothetical protein
MRKVSRTTSRARGVTAAELRGETGCARRPKAEHSRPSWALSDNRRDLDGTQGSTASIEKGGASRANSPIDRPQMRDAVAEICRPRRTLLAMPIATVHLVGVV